MSSVSALVSCSAMVTSGLFCVVQTLPGKVPVAVLMMSDSQNGNLFSLYIPL